MCSSVLTCADTKDCGLVSDCVSQQCERGVCTSCFNGAVVTVADGTETGVDCGGIRIETGAD